MVCVYLGNTTELLPDPSGNSTQHFPLQYLTVWVVELQTNLRKDFTITEKAPTRTLWPLRRCPNFTFTFRGLTE